MDTCAHSMYQALSSALGGGAWGRAPGSETIRRYKNTETVEYLILPKFPVGVVCFSKLTPSLQQASNTRPASMEAHPLHLKLLYWVTTNEINAFGLLMPVPYYNIIMMPLLNSHSELVKAA